MTTHFMNVRQAITVPEMLCFHTLALVKRVTFSRKRGVGGAIRVCEDTSATTRDRPIQLAALLASFAISKS